KGSRAYAGSRVPQARPSGRGSPAGGDKLFQLPEMGAAVLPAAPIFRLSSFAFFWRERFFFLFHPFGPARVPLTFVNTPARFPPLFCFTFSRPGRGAGGVCPAVSSVCGSK